MFDFQLHSVMQEMAPTYTEALQALVDQVATFSGYQLRWKDADRGLRHAQQQIVATQDHALCMQIKGSGRREQCRNWCGKPEQHSRGFGSCHAGLMQWQWAVHEQQTLIGYAALGPFARNHKQLPTPPPQTTISALQELISAAICSFSQLRRVALGQLQRPNLHPCLNALLNHLNQQPLHGERADDLALRVHISTSRLQHLCREELGMSLKTLCQQSLTRQAHALLLDPRALPIQRIAQQLGFREQRAFATWFRHHHNFSPTQWRRQIVI